MKGLMLVAADGSPQTLGALHFARQLAVSRELEAEVVTVVEPSATWLYDPAAGAAASYTGILDSLAEVRRTAVRKQLSTVGRPAAGWPVQVIVGPRALAIAGHAESRGARLIVMGSGRHTWVDRWLGRETVLDMLRVTHVPVLSVPADTRHLPRKALVATDFSKQSLDAARLGVRLLAREAEVHLVHVSWTPAVEVAAASLGAWTTTYEAGARVRLEEAARELEGPDRTVHVHFLNGDLGDELLAFAQRERVDLIVSGSHGYGFVSRVILGSVSTQLIRGARCPVLVAPHHASSELRAEEMDEEELHLIADGHR